MKIQHLLPNERPRERLLRYGPQTLSTLELLAILLSSGNQKANVLELASNLLSRFQSLSELAEASLEELLQVEGIGRAKALQIQAAFSLGKRLEKKEEDLCLEDLPGVIRVISQEFPQGQEAVMVLLCDVKCQIFHREIIALGTLTEVLLHPREVFHLAIRKKAHSLILVHNHPSGDPAPSNGDMKMTQAIAMAGKTLGISLLDHLILGTNSYFSFKEMDPSFKK